MFDVLLPRIVDLLSVARLSSIEISAVARVYNALGKNWKEYLSRGACHLNHGVCGALPLRSTRG